MAIITEEVGDIFDSPPNSILIHACNAKGVWGSGVAVAFKKRFPNVYKEYHSHCLSRRTSSIVGTTLLIPPHSYGSGSKPPSHQDDRYVACLFTSLGFGKTVDPPDTILKNTKAALDDLTSQIEKLRAVKPEMRLGQCRAVRINSGKFGVPWGRTKKILEEGSLDMVVVRPETEEHGEEGVGKRTWKGLMKKGNVRSKSEKGGKLGEPVEAYGWDAFQKAGNQAGNLDESMPTKRRRTREP